MSMQSNRRQFMQTTAAATAGFWVANSLQAEESKSPNEKIRFAAIGVGGKGSSDMAGAGNHGDMVAVCDIDEARLDGAARRYEGAKKYTDFRKMLEEMANDIDAVTVSTPDHTHAPAAIMAMNLGMHCFCQKPLTHSLYEARKMGEVAREKNVATQMGNQGTASDGLRRGAAALKAGVLGDVTELHIWTNRPVWAQGGDRPTPSEAPANINWDAWIGPAPMRPYGNGYHPFAWRGWWDFGTGALGDMACHTMNMPFMGLDLRNPLSVQAETSGHNGDSFPKWSTIVYEFGASGDRKPLKLFWYDGGKRPPADLLGGQQPKASGCLVVGEKGKLYSPDDYGAQFELIGDVTMPDVEFQKSPGHVEEWVNAIRGGDPAVSNFPDYASPLTETVLLGNLAVWADGKKIEWDSENLKAKGMPELDQLIRREYREGWSL